MTHELDSPDGCHTIHLAELGRIEDEPEERLAVITGELRPIGGPDLAVAKTVGGRLKLDRNTLLVRSEEARTYAQDVVRKVLHSELAPPRITATTGSSPEEADGACCCHDRGEPRERRVVAGRSPRRKKCEDWEMS